MADRIRRHALFLSDREIRLVDRTLLIYLALLRIIQVVGSKRESNDIAHITRATQAHFRCKCPVPEGVQ